jgi:hypothetical protein
VAAKVTTVPELQFEPYAWVPNFFCS